MKSVILKKGKDFPILNKHHWVFSGAIYSMDTIEEGEIVQVKDSRQKIIGHGYYSKDNSISVRMLNFSNSDPIQSIKNNLKSAVELRKELFKNENTNCYRIINGEGDGIPGLIVDKYNTTLVFQVTTLGIEKLKGLIITELKGQLDVEQIFEKSKSPARRKSGLNDFEGFIFLAHKETKKIEILERGIKYNIDLFNSHKTGFYLDQREMRTLVRDMSNKKSVLNCFSYTGGFSLSAAAGGAGTVVSVDLSEEVIDQAKENFLLNGFDTKKYKFEAEDVFQYLESNDLSEFDSLILDPPAFAKKKDDVRSACAGYKRLNRLALEKAKPGAIIITCSCSFHVGKELFREQVIKASVESNRKVRIIGEHRLAMDHAINIFHGEIDYLKSLVLYVE